MPGIVSLLPSATEILFAVGAGDDVVGVTFECDHPAEARLRRIVSSTSLAAGRTPGEIDAWVRRQLAAGEDLYHLDEGALKELDPDLVVTQDLCAVCAMDAADVDAALAHLGCTATVLTVDPSTLDDVITSVERIGTAAGRREAAAEFAAGLRERLETVRQRVAGRPRRRVAVLEWTDPPFSAGHWVPDLVTAAGGESVLGVAGGRSVEIGWGDLTAAAPDVVIVSPCGFRLDAAIDLANGILPKLPAGVEVWAIDADAVVVRPGPRLVDGVEAIAGLLHPGAAPARPEHVRRIRAAGTPPADIRP